MSGARVTGPTRMIPHGTCPDTGKQRYPTKGYARRAVKGMKRHTGQRGSYYPCSRCGGFHITHFKQPKDMRASQVARGITVALLLAVLPATAHAQDVTSTPLAQQYLADARAYWGAEPSCPAGYTVLVEPITDQPPEVDGTTSPAAGEAAQPGCWMRIVPTSWEQPGADLCTIVVHEYGHSLGHPHTTDPTSVMDPLTTYTTGMPAACRALDAPPAPQRHRHGRRRHGHRHRERHLRPSRPAAE